MTILALGSAADAQTAMFQKGDAVVSGFAGVTVGSGLPAGADPLDFSFIDLSGTSAEVLNVQPSGPPQGQLIPTSPVLQIKAKDVGQVFAITLDDAPVPNIYLGATSAFGLNIVAPGAGGPQRSKVGAPGATWMPGQFGQGGGPGSIYKVDGTTGAVSVFATVGTNSGAGLGDVVFDKASRQFFVSDLDSGLIYRLAATGATVDSYDHGVTGLGTIGLVGVPDDGSVLDITKPAFNTEAPATWGFTPKARRIGGMAVRNGRLYYAVAEGPQVWSVGVSANGFAADPRLEIDSPGFPAPNAVTDITFDDAGRIYLAERGDQKGSYDDSAFADPHTSPVIRFSPDPANPAAWLPTPDTYAIGATPDYKDATGGIDIGLSAPGGACDLLWSTGDALLAGPQTVNGLQGNSLSAVRPANAPPTQTYLVDYDGQTGDATAFGHIGDVEVWRNCAGVSAAAVPVPVGPPVFYPPQSYPPHFPPGPPPPVMVTKTGDGPCAPVPTIPGLLACPFTIWITNTSPGHPYMGSLSLADPATLPQSAVLATPQPGDPIWQCQFVGDSISSCAYGATPGYPTLPPGGLLLHVSVAMSQSGPLPCQIYNMAVVTLDDGTRIPSNIASDPLPTGTQCSPTGWPGTPPGGVPGGVIVTKTGDSGDCAYPATDYFCGYTITFTNTDTVHAYNGDLNFSDSMGSPATGMNVDMTSDPRWSCASLVGTASITCDLKATPGTPTIPPGGTVTLHISVDIPGASITGTTSCRVDNTGMGASATGAMPIMGTAHLPTTSGCDDSSSSSSTPTTGIGITKTPGSCTPQGASGSGHQYCTYTVTVTNLDPKNDYTGPLTVVDTTDKPAQFDDAGTGSAPWNCPTNDTETMTCTLPAGTPTIPAGKSITLDVKITVHEGDISSSSCNVPNTATVNWTDAAGNPQTTVSQQVFDKMTGDALDNCVPEAIFTIEKHSTGDCVNQVGESFRCPYAIVITGPPSFTGTMTVTDTAGVPGGWLRADPAILPLCTGDGTPTLSCTVPNAVSVVLPVTMFAPGSAFTPPSCSVVNNASVTATDGTHTYGPIAAAPATATLPNCGQSSPPPSPILKIEKTGGQICSTYNTPSGETYACTFQVVVTVLQHFTGVLTVGDDQSASGLSGVFVFPDSSPTWSGCGGVNSPILSCPLPSATYSANQTVPMTVTVSVPKSAITPGVTSCDVPNVATATVTDDSGNVIASESSNVATDTLPPNSECVPMATPFKTMENTIKLPGKCPSGFGDANGNQVNGACPKSLSTLSVTHVLSGPSCPAGWDQADHPERLPRTWKKQVVTGANGISITCARFSVTTTPSQIPSTHVILCLDGSVAGPNGCPQHCPPDTYFDPRSRQCLKRLTPTPLPPKLLFCPDGTPRRFDRSCPTPAPTNTFPKLHLCPNGQPRGRDGQCPTTNPQQATCPFGQFGTPPNCHRILRLPKDTSQTPNAHPGDPVCPDGKTPVPKNGLCPSTRLLHLHNIFNTPPVEQPR